MRGRGVDSVRPDPADPFVAGLLARCRFPDGALTCGLSGGADSTALVALAVATGRPVRAVHVDHGLRRTGDDREVVRRTTRALGIGLEVVEVRVGHGPGLEERARRARYAALPPDVCVGHTADDRAETVVFNIARGAGLAGGAARFPRVHRPLLGLRRAETRDLCDHLGLDTVEDPMNADARHARVRIRTEVLPALAAALGRDPVPALCRHADLLADAAEVIAALAAEVDPTDVAALRRQPRAVASEALRRWVADRSGDPRGVDAAAIERLLAVVAGDVRAAEIPGGHRVARRAGRLEFLVSGARGADPTTGPGDGPGDGVAAGRGGG